MIQLPISPMADDSAPRTAAAGARRQTDGPGGTSALSRNHLKSSFSDLLSSLVDRMRAGTERAAKGKGSELQQGKAGKKVEESKKSQLPQLMAKGNRLSLADPLSSAGGKTGEKSIPGSKRQVVSLDTGVGPAQSKSVDPKVGAALVKGQVAGKEEGAADSQADGSKGRIIKAKGDERDVAGSVEDQSVATAMAAAGLGPAQNSVQTLAKLQTQKDDKLEPETKKISGKAEKKGRLELELEDRRSSAGRAADAASKGAGGAVGASPSEQGKNDQSLSDTGKDSSITVVLKEGSRPTLADLSSQNQSPQTSFADALARELREQYNAEIVQRAQVTLKDGGAGVIRLNLRPETLGAVKIRLEVSDNRIAGHIQVESDEALRAFEQEMRALEQSFRDGGFEGASLDLSLSSNGSGSGGNAYQGRDGGNDASLSFGKVAAVEYDGATVPVGYIEADASVNLLA